MYFDASVVFVTKFLLLFRLALAILWKGERWTLGSYNLHFLIFLTAYFYKVFVFCSVLTKLRDVNRAYLEKSSRYDSYYEAYQKTAETIMVSFFYEFDRPTQGLLKKWPEQSKELYFLKISSRGPPITPQGWTGRNISLYPPDLHLIIYLSSLKLGF